MSMLKYVERIRRMHSLIERKATGTPDEFAQKLGISKSMLMINLAELKELGAPVKYDGYRRTYLYLSKCSIKIRYEIEPTDAATIKGGLMFRGVLSLYSNNIGI